MARPTEDEESSSEAFVGAIDQGTTSSRFIIFNRSGQPIASHQIEFDQIYPYPGWIEHNPHEILKSVEACIAEAVRAFTEKGHKTSQIKTIGLTTQRETTVVWDSVTGNLLHNAIAWPDTRTVSLVRQLKSRGFAEDGRLQRICGLPLSTYPSAVKLHWLIHNEDAVKLAYDEGRLAFGTMDSWLLFQLNGGYNSETQAVHATDVTQASRTMLMNLETLDYDAEALAFFGLDRAKIRFPAINPSSHASAFGRMAAGPLKGHTITGSLGDQSAALVGQLGFGVGEAKNTYGTGCFLLCNVGSKPVYSQHGLLATIAYDFGNQYRDHDTRKDLIPDASDSSSSNTIPPNLSDAVSSAPDPRSRHASHHKPIYALEGSIAVAGSAIRFLQRNLGLLDAAAQLDEIALSVPNSGGCVFVTAFSGLFAPYWIDDAKGTIFGLTQHTQKGHLARATIEATCFQTRAILDSMERDSRRTLTHLAVDGGMSTSDLCMQTQADLIGIPVRRPTMRETTCFGAAIAGGLATGVWKDIDELRALKGEDVQIFRPSMDRQDRDLLFRQWNRAVEMARGWTG